MYYLFSSFSDELIKIAQQEPGFPDPRMVEIAQRQQSTPKQKYLNKEVLKQFGKNTLAIGAGTAAGEGLATLTNMGLEAGAKRLGHKLHPAVPHVVRGVTIPVMGAGSLMAYRAMRQRADEKLEEARQRSAAEKGEKPTDVSLEDWEKINPGYGGGAL